MQDHLAIGRIEMMAVTPPITFIDMDLNGAASPSTTDFDLGIQEIRPSFAIPCPGPKDAQTPAISKMEIAAEMSFVPEDLHEMLVQPVHLG